VLTHAGCEEKSAAIACRRSASKTTGIHHTKRDSCAWSLTLPLPLLLLPPAGEHIGDGTPPKVDIAVDPLDGTTLTAQGRSGAIAVRPPCC
jgi:hypothetical protein